MSEWVDEFGVTQDHRSPQDGAPAGPVQAALRAVGVLCDCLLSCDGDAAAGLLAAEYILSAQPLPDETDIDRPGDELDEDWREEADPIGTSDGVPVDRALSTDASRHEHKEQKRDTKGRFAYVGTRSEHLEHATKNGLVPGVTSYDDSYSEYDDGKHIFFTDDEDYAANNYGDRNTVIRFPWPEEHAKNDKNKFGRYLSNQFAAKISVKPEYIEVNTEGGWIPLHQHKKRVPPKPKKKDSTTEVKKLSKDEQEQAYADFDEHIATMSANAAFSFDIHNVRAQGILNRTLQTAKGLTTAARRDLAAALKESAGGSGAAILNFVDKYRVQLARLLTATQLAALLEGAREVAAKVPPLGEVPTEGLPVAEQERIAVAGAEPPEPPPVPEKPPRGSPEEVHFPTIDEAVRSLSERRVMSKAEYDALDAAARAKAFTVANVAAQETLTKIRDSLAENVREGTDYETWRKKVLEEVDQGTFLSPAHQENVFRTNVQTAFSDGQMAVLQHPLVRSGFPYADYDAIHDDRVRENHLALETLGIQGTNTYRTDDPVFQLFRPPWDYQDRCGWTPKTVRQAAENGIKEAQEWLRTGVEPTAKAWVDMPPFQPPEGFRRSLAGAPLSVQLSLQPLAAFSTDAEGHQHSGKGKGGGQFTSSCDTTTASKTTVEAKPKKRAAPGSQIPEGTRNKLRALGMVGTFPPADVADFNMADLSEGEDKLKFVPLMSWSQTTKSGRVSRQYRYTQAFHDRNAAEKFNRVTAIEPHMPKIIAALSANMADVKLSNKQREAAAIASIIRETGLRPTDGDESVKHRHFGVSSLQARHARIVGNEVQLDFVGKEGVRNISVVREPSNVAFLKAALNKSKGKQPIFNEATSDHAGDILKATSKAVGGPADIKLKDLRTLKATQTARQVVSSFGGPPPPLTGDPNKDVKAIQSAILGMSAEVAKVLNNTPIMARDNYIHPEVWKQWQSKLSRAK